MYRDIYFGVNRKLFETELFSVLKEANSIDMYTLNRYLCEYDNKEKMLLRVELSENNVKNKYVVKKTNESTTIMTNDFVIYSSSTDNPEILNEILCINKEYFFAKSTTKQFYTCKNWFCIIIKKMNKNENGNKKYYGRNNNGVLVFEGSYMNDEYIDIIISEKALPINILKTMECYLKKNNIKSFYYVWLVKYGPYTEIVFKIERSGCTENDAKITNVPVTPFSNYHDYQVIVPVLVYGKSKIYVAANSVEEKPIYDKIGTGLNRYTLDYSNDSTFMIFQKDKIKEDFMMELFKNM